MNAPEFLSEQQQVEYLNLVEKLQKTKNGNVRKQIAFSIKNVLQTSPVFRPDLDNVKRIRHK